MLSGLDCDCMLGRTILAGRGLAPDTGRNLSVELPCGFSFCGGLPNIRLIAPPNVAKMPPLVYRRWFPNSSMGL
jgi:hypothetical protein